ncbi:hypothetical protein H0H81_001940 [Sphagnurus paluster]|uniref:Uncharacterized protein n=1 Tax=Sphagnurus paluster TaxID=117069 RepID=A0A9P7GFT0_9AGAR|nr:hypothetical protein H0H81_001940 [Sphagnurus paluster]
MEEISVDSNAIRDAIAAAQAEATAVPLRDSDGDDATVHGVHETTVEIPAFEGFTEFELDLSLLSPPPSPPASMYTDARSLSPTSSPRPSMSMSMSFHSSISQSVSHSQNQSALNAADNSVSRGPWPLKRYVGRGTPIYRSRRIEWGGVGSEEVSEDGFLFSDVGSTSLDSAFRPSTRSISPEWSVLHRRPSTLPARARSRTFAVEPPTPTPEIEIEIETQSPGEWASFMQTVLSGTAQTAPTASGASTSQLLAPVFEAPQQPLAPIIETPIHPFMSSTVGEMPPISITMSPEDLNQLNANIEADLGIDAALDLGLGYRGGMNWFNLGMRPASGRESPSIYSSHPPSPMPSRPPSRTPFDNRSTASIKVEPSVVGRNATSGSQAWWRKFMRRLKKVHVLLGSH